MAAPVAAATISNAPPKSSVRMIYLLGPRRQPCQGWLSRAELELNGSCRCAHSPGKHPFRKTSSLLLLPLTSEPGAWEISRGFDAHPHGYIHSHGATSPRDPARLGAGLN